MANMSPEGEMLERLEVTFSGSQSFRYYLARSGMPGLRQRQPPEATKLVTECDQVQVGFKQSDPYR